MGLSRRLSFHRHNEAIWNGRWMLFIFSRHTRILAEKKQLFSESDAVLLRPRILGPSSQRQ